MKKRNDWARRDAYHRQRCVALTRYCATMNTRHAKIRR